MAKIEINVILQSAIDINTEASFKEAVFVAEKNDWYVVVKFTKVKFDFGEETLFILSPRHGFCHVTIGGKFLDKLAEANKVPARDFMHAERLRVQLFEDAMSFLEK